MSLKEYLLKNSAVAAVYFVLGYVSFNIGNATGGTTLFVWLPGAVALGAILVWGYRVWPGILLGASSAIFFIGNSVPTSIAIGTSNTLGLLLGSYILLNFKGFDKRLKDLKSYLIFILLGAILTSAIGSFLGTTTSVAMEFIDRDNFSQVWYLWWLVDGIAILLITPFILALWGRKHKVTFRNKLRVTEFIIVSLLIIGITYFVFFYPPEGNRTLVFFFILPILVWAGVRFDHATTSWLIILSTGIAIIGTVFADLQFTPEDINRRLITIQYFMGLVAITGMFLAISVREKNDAIKKVRVLNKKLRKEVKARDHFLATLSHELRNPLAPMTSALELISVTKEIDDPELKEYISMLEKQVKHTTVLVNDLLDVSRMLHGKIHLSKEKIEVGSFVEDVSAITRSEFNKRNQKFDVIVPREKIYVFADPDRLKQLITNLLMNAAKYTPNGGNITISIEKNAINAIISVKDNGIGIEKKFLESIFKPFSQVDESRNTNTSGMGIGLMLARIIAENHGGEITAHSRGLGEGSKFIVKLPLLKSVPSSTMDINAQD